MKLYSRGGLCLNIGRWIVEGKVGSTENDVRNKKLRGRKEQDISGGNEVETFKFI